MANEIEDRMKAIASLIERLAHYETEAALCKLVCNPSVRQSNIEQAFKVRKELRDFGIPVTKGEMS